MRLNAKRLHQAGTAILLSMLLSPAGFAQTSTPVQVQNTAPALQIGSSARKVPAGTYLRVAFNTALDSRITETGETFTAALTDDFLYNDHGVSRVVLPAGTFVRGRIEKVQRPTFFSKGGAIFLGFDHVVLPSGEQLPLDLVLSPTNEDVNRQGALYSDPGIKHKLGQSVVEGQNTFGRIVDNGVKAGKDMADGLGQIVTVPLAAVGGAVAGTAVTAGKSVVSVVGKGDSMVIKPGDTVMIDFGGSFNIPSE